MPGITEALVDVLHKYLGKKEELQNKVVQDKIGGCGFMEEMNSKAMYKIFYGLFVCTAVRDG